MKIRDRIPACLVAACLVIAATSATAEDWPQFRGPGGRATGAAVPLEWSESKNLLWKTVLPGGGSSSPIVHGDAIFVTCWSEGAGGQGPTRHLLKIDPQDGKVLWQRDIAAPGPDDPYSGYLTEHGYASNTPVTDGEMVWAFLGKAGVVAFDMEGKEIWRTGVGTESSNRRWGSGASLILHGDLVICNAAEESQSIRALDKRTGKEVWKAEAAALELAYGTPGIARLADGTEEIVVAVPGEVWGLDPRTGKLRWHAEMGLTGNVSPSVIVDGDVIYVFGGFRSSGSLALRAGGRGDVTKSHVLWTSRTSSYVATPVLHEGHLYWIDDKGLAFCADAKTGKEVYKERVREITSGGRPVYASPVVADGKVYVVTRYDGTLVLPAAPRYDVLAHNVFAGDESDASGTPALVDGRIYLRSGKFLYAIGSAE
jgi:outer membrane protein assembly factor BamB